MRSEVVLAALQTKNRFELCHLAFKTIRKLHNPGTRIQDTASDALQKLAGMEQSEVLSVPTSASKAETERERGSKAGRVRSLTQRGAADVESIDFVELAHRWSLSRKVG